MDRNLSSKSVMISSLLVALGQALPGAANAMEVYLCAGPTTLNLPGGASVPVWGYGVITSYSIHYTKLYEAVPPGYELIKEEDRNVDLGDAMTPAPLLLPPECVGLPHPVPAYRITSYNVCYTKLLRELYVFEVVAVLLAHGLAGRPPIV